MSQLGERLRELRQQRGLTSTALAQPKYSVSYVSQIERGQRKPSVEALAYFARRLRVSAHFLATGVPDDVDAWLRYELEAARRDLKAEVAEKVEDRIRAVLDKAEEYEVAGIKAQALPLLGEALARLPDRNAEAIAVFEQTLREELTDNEAGAVVAKLGVAYRTAGELHHATELVEGFLRREFEVPLDPVVVTELQTVLISLYFERGDMLRAERAASAALASTSETTPAHVRANAYWAASRVLAEDKRWDAALQLADRARLLMESIEDRARVAYLHTASAFICLDAEPPRLAEAHEHLDQAEEILAGFDLPTDLAYVHTERSRLALMEDQPQDALGHARQAFALSREDGLEQARARFLEGRAWTELGEGEKARVALRQAAEMFNRLGARQQEASCYREIGELDLADGDLAAAVQAFRQGLEVLDPRRSRA